LTWVCEKLLAVTIMVMLPATTEREPSGYLMAGPGCVCVREDAALFTKRRRKKGFSCFSLCNQFC